MGVSPKGSAGAACVCWACLKIWRESVLGVFKKQTATLVATGIVGFRKRPHSTAHMPLPVLRIHTLGRCPRTPVKTGARVCRFWGCNHHHHGHASGHWLDLGLSISRPHLPWTSAVEAQSEAVRTYEMMRGHFNVLPPRCCSRPVLCQLHPLPSFSSNPMPPAPARLFPVLVFP